MTGRFAPAVLVHGAFHGRWCWAAIIDQLESLGIEATAVELPFTGYADDLAVLIDALDAVDRDRAVVVAHSLAGMLISDPAIGRVGHRVYVAAFLPDVGEDPVGLAQSAPPTELRIEFGDRGQCWVEPDVARRAFFWDLEPDDAEAAIGRLRPMSTSSLLPPPATARVPRSAPTTYVICELDRAFHPDLQRRLAARATRSITLNVGHSVLQSNPTMIVEVLAGVAT